ncbi:cyclase family protein [Clostridium sp. BSD9I1]|uniref:cyclase family protein n=1 Tax=Clostridium sp. BSD9I1 TaxID=2003589 RepID=UPI001648A672|nr:cyclase family protein [Clostridium sp. BSD9I1]
MIQLIDISLKVGDTIPIWPNMPAPKIGKLKDILNGDEVTNSCLYTDIHCGTHIDAPAHHIPNGKLVEDIQLQLCTGKVFVIEITDDVINKEIINTYKNVFCEYKKVLFKTKNSTLLNNKFDENYVAFDMSGADEISKYNMELLGIDYLSIQKFGKEYNTVHKILLEKDIVLLEGLDLRNVESGEYELYAFPINISNSEGAPVRAVLKRESE